MKNPIRLRTFTSDARQTYRILGGGPAPGQAYVVIYEDFP